MSDGVPTEDGDQETARPPGWAARLGSISVDWWATGVAFVIVTLAVADVLPKIPW